MISSIHQFSLAGFLSFQRACPRPDRVAVISLLDKGESVRYGRPFLQPHHSALSLWFEDSYEEPGAPLWPDEPSSLQHLRFAQEHGERVPTLADAEKIVAYVYLLHAQPDEISLAVHCHGGVSRSTAVADWVSARLFLPVTPPAPGIPVSEVLPMPNPRVLRLLDKAWSLRNGGLNEVDSQREPGSAPGSV